MEMGKKQNVKRFEVGHHKKRSSSSISTAMGSMKGEEMMGMELVAGGDVKRYKTNEGYLVGVGMGLGLGSVDYRIEQQDGHDVIVLD